MILAGANRQIERSDAFVSNTFNISAGAKAFEVLSSGIYSNKPAAVVRETLCNAVDSHKEQGNASTPILLHCPNRLEPWFSVRDYGTGMSHEKVTNLYSTYFGSDKSNSNLGIGGFGLGSKAPLSYVDSFTVTVWHGNKKRVYNVFKNEDAIPEIALLHEQDSIEPVGVEVKVPVKTQDIDDFIRQITIYTRYATIPVECVGAKITHNKRNYIYEGSICKVHDEGHWNDHTITFVVGGVPYEHSHSEIINLSITLPECSLEMHLPIGSVEIAASREKISAKPTTIKYIQSVIDAERATASKAINNQVLNADTYKDALNIIVDKSTKWIKFDCKWLDKNTGITHNLERDKVYQSDGFHVHYMEDNLNLISERYSKNRIRLNFTESPVVILVDVSTNWRAKVRQYGKPCWVVNKVIAYWQDAVWDKVVSDNTHRVTFLKISELPYIKTDITKNSARANTITVWDHSKKDVNLTEITDPLHVFVGTVKDLKYTYINYKEVFGVRAGIITYVQYRKALNINPDMIINAIDNLEEFCKDTEDNKDFINWLSTVKGETPYIAYGVRRGIDKLNKTYKCKWTDELYMFANDHESADYMFAKDCIYRYNVACDLLSREKQSNIKLSSAKSWPSKYEWIPESVLKMLGDSYDIHETKKLVELLNSGAKEHGL